MGHTWGGTLGSPLLDQPAAGTREQDRARETVLPRPPQTWTVHLVLGASLTQAPRRSPLPGWRRDPLASWARSPAPAHGGARGEVGTFPLPIRKRQCPAPDAAYLRGLCVPQVCPGRGLDPRPRGPRLSTGPREHSPSPACVSMAPGPSKVREEGAEGLGVKHRPPRLRSRALRPRRRSCPGLRRALPSPLAAFHGPSVTAP